jgi:pimeloyl-ACP methyl ester carboxylesterase
VAVAIHDLGGAGPPLLLVHATGFCAGVFGPLVAAGLGAAFRCLGLDLRGHGGTLSPPGLRYAWDGFADDVLAAVDGLGLGLAGGAGGGAGGRPPLIGLGHSSGGAALLLAEAVRPGTFAALWCYEPIVWPDPEAARERAARLAEGARRRRDAFGSREEALANFASKPPFSVLHPDALAAYVGCGFADDAEAGGVRLRCAREVEAEIYLEGVEGDRMGRLGAVGCPVDVACGERTDAIGPGTAAVLAAALPAGRSRVLPGVGHFGPLEDPALVAATVLDDLTGTEVRVPVTPPR